MSRESYTHGETPTTVEVDYRSKLRVYAIEGQDAGGVHREGSGGCIEDVSGLGNTECAGIDGGRSRVGVVAGERERAGAVFREGACAGNDAAQRLVGGGGVDEVAAVCDGSGVAAASEATGGSDL